LAQGLAGRHAGRAKLQRSTSRRPVFPPTPVFAVQTRLQWHFYNGISFASQSAGCPARQARGDAVNRERPPDMSCYNLSTTRPYLSQIVWQAA
jgi:hypothetical protein